MVRLRGLESKSWSHEVGFGPVLVGGMDNLLLEAVMFRYNGLWVRFGFLH